MEAFGSFSKPQQSSSSPPAATAMEELGNHHELEKPRRTQAFVAVAIEVANGENPSTGAAPQLQQLLDLCSPVMTAAVKGERNQVQPANDRETHSQPCDLEQNGDQQAHHRTKTETHRPRTPEKGILQIPSSPASPMTMEEDVKGARKRPGKIIPPRRRCRCPTDAARQT